MLVKPPIKLMTSLNQAFKLDKLKPSHTTVK